MADVRVVVEQFSARHWSRQPYEYEDFMPGERVIAMRYESGYSIFARDSDPVSRYMIEIDQFRAPTSSLGPENTIMRAGGSSAS